MASNLLLKTHSARKSRSVPEMNLSGRDKLLEYLKQIKTGITELRQLRTEYQATNDQNKEKQIRDRAATVCSEVGNATTCANWLIQKLKKDVDERKRLFSVKEGEETTTRFIESIVAAAQIELCRLVQDFSFSQLEIKELFKSKMKRTIHIYDPSMSDDETVQLLNDPTVNLLGHDSVHEYESLSK